MQDIAPEAGLPRFLTRRSARSARGGRWLWGIALAALAALAGVVGIGERPALAQAPAQGRVYIEDSAGSTPLIKQAQALQAEGRHADAVAIYQRLLQQSARRLVKVEEGRYTDLQRWAVLQITDQPELLKQYRWLYESTARQRMQGALEPTPRASGLLGVLNDFEPSEAALEAGMHLAALHLLEARPRFARGLLQRLKDHPALTKPEHLGRWRELMAAASIYQQPPADAEPMLQKLEEADQRRTATLLRRWRDGMNPPALKRSLPWADRPLPRAELPQDLRQPLWKVTLGESDDSDTDRRQRLRRPEIEDFAYLPTLLGDRLYVNHEAGVMALDLQAGWTVWDTRIDYAKPRGWAGRRTKTLHEPRGVVARPEAVVAVVGPIQFTNPRFAEHSDPTRLVCLDPEDGSIRWRMQPEQIGLENSFFYGTPLPGPNRVYVMIGRLATGFQHAAVAAIRVSDGELIWKRLLSSVDADSDFQLGGISRDPDRGERLYVADGLGAVACLDGLDGSMSWLRKLDPPASRQSNVHTRMSSTSGIQIMGGPVLLPAGLFSPWVRREAAAMLLDPSDGTLIRTLQGERWEDARQIVPAGEDLLVLSEEQITLLDGSDPRLSPKWERSLHTALVGEAIAGRLAVTEGYVMIPAAQRLYALSLEDGQRIWQQPVQRPGNPLPLPEQVVVAARDGVDAYLSWPTARERLYAQIKQHPEDPAPALSLAELAFSTGRFEAMLRALDDALAALRREPGGRLSQPDASSPQRPSPDSLAARQVRQAAQRARDRRRLVFRQLLRYTGQSERLSAQMRRELFDRLASATSDAQDEVVYQFALGEFLEQREQVGQAMENYHAILADEDLSQVVYRGERVARRAGLEARLRLERLIQQGGAEAYRRYERLAERRLQELSAERPVPVRQLLSLAQQYPQAEAAAEALLLAAQTLVQRGEPRQALNHLQHAYRRTQKRSEPDPRQLERIAGMILATYTQVERPEQAHRWLDRFAREHPELRPLWEGQRVDVSTLRGMLPEPQRRGGSVGNLRLPLGKPVGLNGRLLLPKQQVRSRWPHEHVLLRKGGSIELRSLDDLSRPRWSIRSRPSEELVSMDERTVVLRDREDQSLRGIDLSEGAVAWGPLEMRGLLEGVGDQEQREANRPVLQRRLEELLDPALPLRRRIMAARRRQRGEPPAAPKDRLFLRGADGVLCLADGLGRVLGIERSSGMVLWQVLCPFDRLEHLAMNDEAVALGGRRGLRSDSPSGQILLLDPFTGEPIQPVLHTDEPIQWLAVGGDRQVVHATETHLAAHQLVNGWPSWRLNLGQQQQSVRRGWIGPDLVLIENEASHLVTIDAASGTILHRQIVSLEAGSGRNQLLDMQHHMGLWHTLTPAQAIAVRPDGEIAWRQPMAQERNAVWRLQLLGSEHVFLLDSVGENLQPRRPDERPDRPNDQRVYVLSILERQTGRLVQHPLDLGPLPKLLGVRVAACLDNALVLGAEDTTIVLPGSSAEQPDLPAR